MEHMQSSEQDRFSCPKECPKCCFTCSLRAYSRVLYPTLLCHCHAGSSYTVSLPETVDPLTTITFTGGGYTCHPRSIPRGRPLFFSLPYFPRPYPTSPQSSTDRSYAVKLTRFYLRFGYKIIGVNYGEVITWS